MAELSVTRTTPGNEKAAGERPPVRETMPPDYDSGSEEPTQASGLR